MSPRLLIAVLAIAAFVAHTPHAYTIVPSRLAAGASYVDDAVSGPPNNGAAARAQEIDFIKRFLPAKERRAPLDGFEDMSGFLRTIDGIQKPRFG